MSPNEKYNRFWQTQKAQVLLGLVREHCLDEHVRQIVEGYLTAHDSPEFFQIVGDLKLLSRSLVSLVDAIGDSG